MHKIKQYLGIVWMLLGPTVIILLMVAAYFNISSGGTRDINKPLPWVIIITIFTPIGIGLSMFGWYVFKGEYGEVSNSDGSFANSQ